MRKTFDSNELGAIQIHYYCAAFARDCADEGETTVSVDPTFFEESGTPVCHECGEDMTVFSATVEV